MCLCSKDSYRKVKAFLKNPVLTTKEIVVYKILNKDNTSPCMKFKYQKGYWYYQRGKKFGVDKSLCGHNAFIHDGLHAFVNLRTAFDSRGVETKIVEMVIPVGSIVIYGVDDDIVTDNLIWY